MEKEVLIRALKKIYEAYFSKQDYVSAEQINLAIDVVEDCEPELLTDIN